MKGAKLKIAFVCEGNTCRSPMALFVVREFLKREGIKGVSLYSRGVNPTECEMNNLAKEALLFAGIKVGKHVPKKMTAYLSSNCDAVIAMTTALKVRLEESGCKNVYSAFEICGEDIPDPYGRGVKAYVEAERQTEKLALRLVGMIKQLLNKA